jgi:hypothetical protein
VVSTDLPGARWLRDDLAGSDPAAVPQLMALTSDEAGFVAALRRLTTGSRAATAKAAPKAGRGRAAPAGTGRPKAGRASAGSAGAADGRAARAASARAFAARHTWERRAEVLAAAIGLRAPQPSVHGGAQVRA